MRIVSLLASATEIVCALGAGDLLVGRSHECDSPGWVRELPACTAPAFDVSMASGAIDAEVRRRLRAGEPLYTIDTPLIEQLRPDLLIAQTHCEVCAVTPQDIDRSLDHSGAALPGVRQLALSAATVDGIFASIGIVAGALGLESRGQVVVERERARLERVRAQARQHRPKSVVMIEWADPIFAMGNWGPELVEIANGELLIGHKGEYSSAIDAEQIRDADPEYLIVAPCGFNLERSLQEQEVLARHPWWHDLQAVRNGNVVYADGNLFFNRSGMTIAETAEIIAEILHGCSFGQKKDDEDEVPWLRSGTRSGCDRGRDQGTPTQPPALLPARLDRPGRAHDLATLEKSSRLTRVVQPALPQSGDAAPGQAAEHRRCAAFHQQWD